MRHINIELFQGHSRFVGGITQRLVQLSCALSVALLVACGGGGGGSPVASAGGPAADVLVAPPAAPAPAPAPAPPPLPPAVGSVQLSVIAGALGGAGYQNGTGSAARMGSISDLVYEADGNLIFADPSNAKLRRVTPAGVVTDVAAPGGGLFVLQVAVEASGNILAASSNKIYRITPAGALTTIAGLDSVGNLDGASTVATLNLPSGLTVAADGTIYFASSASHTIRKISPAGVVSTIAGVAGTSGNLDGAGAAATFQRPVGLALSPDGTSLLVADAGNVRIRSVNLATNVVSHFSGSTARSGGVADGDAVAARFSGLSSFRATGLTGYVVSDINTSRIRRISLAGGVTTIAGPAATDPIEAGNQDGPATSARFLNPNAVAVSPDGTKIAIGEGNSAVRVLSSGTVSTLAGLALKDTSVDGALATARFSGRISGMAVLADGALVLAQEGINNNLRRKLRSISAAGDVSSDVGSTEFVYAMGSNAAGNVYYMDYARLLSRSSAGVSTVVAGSNIAAGFANGTGPDARFENPTAMAVAADGNVYVAESSSYRIRKVSPLGVVTTLAGDGVQGAVDGTGAAARMRSVSDMAFNSAGELIFVDNGSLRKITPAGVVTTLTGYAACQGKIALDTGNNIYCAAAQEIKRLLADGSVQILIAAPTDQIRLIKVSPASPQLNNTNGFRLLRDTATALEFVLTDSSEAVVLKLSLPR